MPYTEEQYRLAGYTTRKLRLKLSDARALDALAKRSGQTISGAVSELVRKESRKKHLREP